MSNLVSTGSFYFSTGVLVAVWALWVLFDGIRGDQYSKVGLHFQRWAFGSALIFAGVATVFFSAAAPAIVGVSAIALILLFGPKKFSWSPSDGLVSNRNYAIGIPILTILLGAVWIVPHFISLESWSLKHNLEISATAVSMLAVMAIIGISQLPLFFEKSRAFVAELPDAPSSELSPLLRDGEVLKRWIQKQKS